MNNYTVKTFQIQHRSQKLVVPCDKLSRNLFKLPAEKYAAILAGNCRYRCSVGEKKGAKIFIECRLELVDGYTDFSPPDAFAREVLFHAISLYAQDVQVFSPLMMLHSLTGVDKPRVYKEQYAAIRRALDKLANTRIEINLEPMFKDFPSYRKNYSGKSIIAERLLPSFFLEGKINGQKTFAVEMLDESPLMTVAKVQKQILTYDATPLAIAGQKNTPNVIVSKNKLLRRINLIKTGRLSNPSVVIEKFCEECGIVNADRWQRQDFLKSLTVTLQSCKAVGVIKNAEFEKQGNAYHAIKIIY